MRIIILLTLIVLFTTHTNFVSGEETSSGQQTTSDPETTKPNIPSSTEHSRPTDTPTQLEPTTGSPTDPPETTLPPPKLIRCTVDEDCSDHAISVWGFKSTGCYCRCRNGWNGAACENCPFYYNASKDCGECADGRVIYPYCPLSSYVGTCSVERNCNDHATSVNSTGQTCVCTCRNQWAGPFCGYCPANYDAYKDCGVCAPGFAHYPQCDPSSNVPACSLERDCSGHAIAVSGTTEKGQVLCLCQCRNAWSGATCATCKERYNATADCGACAPGHLDYPRCTAPSECALFRTGMSCPKGCWWNRVVQSCDPIPCRYIPTTDSLSCNANPQCYFSDNFGCVPLSCSTYDFAGCFSLSQGACEWNRLSGVCVPRSCESFTNPATCLGAAHCVYDVTTSLCKSISCRWFQPKDCTLPNCMPLAQADNTLVCTDRPCKEYNNGAACAADTKCTLLRAEGTFGQLGLKCIAKTCEEFTSWKECAAPCRWNFASSTCNEVPCVNYSTQQTCPVLSQVCSWNAAFKVCFYKACLAMNSTECATSFRCTPLGKECVDASVKTLPCYRLASPLLCGIAPLRCTYLQSTSNSQLGACLPIETTNVLPCYSPIFYSAETCPQDRCEFHYNRCINPVCPAITDETKCVEQGCRYWKSRQVCVDPNVLAYFPCTVFDSQNTCPGRCQWRNNECSSISEAAQSTETCSDLKFQLDCLESELMCKWAPTSSQQGQCAPAPCSSLSADSCPLSRCRVFDGKCFDMCPQAFPFLCSTTGTCAKSKDLCVRCATSQVQCWNSVCVSSAEKCGCPPITPFRCSNGHCSVAQLNCTTCSNDQVLCESGSCADTVDDCPCPLSSPYRCTETNNKRVCVSSLSLCEKKCPSLTPVKCWTGSCAVSEIYCPCTVAAPYRCATDQKCYADKISCPCPASTPIRCPDKVTCVATQSDCLSTGKPSVCNDKETVVPTINIEAIDGEFDISLWFRVKASIDYTVCGRDRSNAVEVEWSVTSFLNGTAVENNNEKKAKVFGQTASIPPFTFTAEIQYILTARAQVRISQDKTVYSSSSINVKGKAPIPKLKMIGGVKRVTNNNELSLAVDVQDTAARGSDIMAYSWACCSGNDCLSDCPELIANSINSAKTKYLRIQSVVPEGIYKFTVYYKGVQASQYVHVKDQSTPSIQIIATPRTIWAGMNLWMYAVVRYQYQQNVTIQWFVNGNELPNANKRFAAIPGSYFIAGETMNVSVRATTLDGKFGESSVEFTPRKEVVPQSCKVEIADSSTQVTSLETRLRITAEVSTDEEEEASDELEFNFGYKDFQSTEDEQSQREKEIILSPFAQKVPTFEVVAPLLWKNKGREITFFVSSRTKQRRAVVKCRVMVGEAKKNSSQIVDEQHEQLEEASKFNDTAAVIQTVTRVCAALSIEKDTKTIYNTTKVALGILLRSVRKQKLTISLTERMETIKALRTLVVNDSDSSKLIIDDGEDDSLAILHECFDSENGGEMDMDEDAPAALEILGRLNKTVEMRNVTVQLAHSVAVGMNLGEDKEIRTAGIGIAGISRAATDLGNQSVGSGDCEMMLPTSFSIPETNETTVVSLTSVEFDENPVGLENSPAMKNLSTKVADFAVIVDGEKKQIKELESPIEIKLRLSRTVQFSTNKNATEQLKCMYFETRTGRWSSEGVTFKSYDATTNMLTCRTTHLSTFGGFADTDPVPTTGIPLNPTEGVTTLKPETTAPATLTPSETTAPPATRNPDATTTTPTHTTQPPSVTPLPGPTDETSNKTTTLIVASAIGAVLLVGLVAGVMIKSRTAKNGENGNDGENGTMMEEFSRPVLNYEHLERYTSNERQRSLLSEL